MLMLLVLLLLLTMQTQGGKGGESGTEAYVSKHTLFANKTVWCAIIQTDPATANILGRDFHRVPQGVNGTAVDNALLRIENGKYLASTLPFAVEFWWSVFVQPCPQRPSKGNDRGVATAHQQIWADWVYQGTRGVDKERAKETDVLVVFEDDAVAAVKDVHKALQTELSDMSHDLLFLGWCYGRRNMPMCTHAYALTRAAAKKMLAEWDSCNTHSIDGQWRGMVQQGLFTWRKAKQETYLNDLREGFEDNPHYFTRGIFVQKKATVSFNHHGFQNNAG